ncbi:MAG TPA: winged helix-turn-helix domain-containing protein [Thermoplasmata archaeon]|nr:winged helix-turn-helix domain-containing protein [Thermoplasmata archaeon]
MDQMLWYLLAGTRGGANRLRLLGLLKARPYNANQLSELLGLDYRTVRHHLRLLVKNGLLANPSEELYGSLYFLSAATCSRWSVVEDIQRRIGSLARSPPRTRGALADARSHGSASRSA